MSSPFRKAADLISEAQCLVITAGAGLGVDSGLPDFRGENGFWKNYPAYRHLKINYMDFARLDRFEEDPQFGWGFHGHRMKLYRETQPHDGFQILRTWIEQRNLEHFVVTSNVDGQFQKAGFSGDCVYEIHGSIHHLQCSAMCDSKVWNNDLEIEVNPTTMRAANVPRCPKCGGVVRPNIQFFTDYGWVRSRCNEQNERFLAFWKRTERKPTVVIEIGAGRTAPSIRIFGLALAQRDRCRLVRINPREPDAPPPHLSIRAGGLEALRGIEQAIEKGDSKPFLKHFYFN